MNKRITRKQGVFNTPTLAAIIMLATACSWLDDDKHLKIINNSEYSITWVVIVDKKTGEIAANKKGNELIAKNSSKSFSFNEHVHDFIACIETEEILEPMCSIVISGSDESITWNGNGSSGWVPATSFSACPKVFPQCNSEVKDE
jgi:hypothetical protein